MNVNVSEKTEIHLRDLANRSGKAVEDFAGDLLADAVEEKSNPDEQKNGEKRERKHNLLKFAGMFSGGDGKTSENYKQILRDEIDSVAGFTTDKEK